MSNYRPHPVRVNVARHSAGWIVRGAVLLGASLGACAALVLCVCACRRRARTHSTQGYRTIGSGRAPAGVDLLSEAGSVGSFDDDDEGFDDVPRRARGGPSERGGRRRLAGASRGGDGGLESILSDVEYWRIYGKVRGDEDGHDADAGSQQWDDTTDRAPSVALDSADDSKLTVMSF